MRATLESHLISPAAFDILLRNPFTRDDFEAFLAERQRTLQDAIEDLLVKERLDLAPQLRELDAQMEDIELRLRDAITNAWTATLVASTHVQQKVNERLKPLRARTQRSTPTTLRRCPASSSTSTSANSRTRLRASRSWPHSRSDLQHQGGAREPVRPARRTAERDPAQPHR